MICLLAASLLTLSELQEGTVPKTGEEVAMRGFLYEKSDGQWFLADAPNIKSCCIDQKHVYIRVSGTLPDAPPLTAVTLIGTFTTEDGRYQLQDCIIQKEEAHPKAVLWLGGAALLLASLATWKRDN